MLRDNIQITIITLTKNDKDKFIKTLNSINNQTQRTEIEWLIMDGSPETHLEELNIYKDHKDKVSSSFLIRHIHSN